MKDRSRIMLSSLVVMACLATVAVLLTVNMMYNTAFEQTRKQLTDTVKSEAHLIEAVARFNDLHSLQDHPDGSADATLSQIVDAHAHDSGFGESGEFTFATLQDNAIVFLLSHRHDDNFGTREDHAPVPMSGTLAEPMRRALQGRSGTVVGPDYRGETVLAAFEPVAGLNCGIVAKIDVAEIRRPFLRAGFLAIVVVILLICGGTLLILKPLLFRLEETTARHAAIIETAADPIITITGQGLIGSFNPAAERLFGFKGSEVLGKNVRMLMPSPFREEHDGYLARYQKTDKKKIIGTGREVVGQRKNGTTFPIYLSVSEVVFQNKNKNKRGNVSQRLFTGIIRDLTDQKRAETDLVHAKDVAEAANRAKSEFLANMSHEIRTPMTAILGFTDILLDGVVQPQNIEAARTIKENGEHLIHVINDILDLSKIEAEKLDVECIDCSPHKIVADVASLLRVRAAKQGLTLDVRFDGPTPEAIQSDPTRLRQVLINVVGNAIKFTDTGSVQIVTRLLNGPGVEPQLQFDVVDTGIGIAEDQIEKLFLPFTQADGSTTRQFGGTGLGLTISKRLVEVLGGRMSVVSTVGKGSTFSITVSTGSLDGVQLLEGGSEAVRETGRAKRVAQTDAPLADCRILLAEDGPDNQRLIGFILKKAGAEVTVADNGQIAFDLATTALRENSPFDVILMDMQMPVLDGYEATRQLRDANYTAPIIALTAHAMSGDRQKCLDAGCDDYLTKPIDRNKLVDTVASHAEKAGTVPETAPLTKTTIDS